MVNRPTLEESIRALSPEALAIFKRQLAAMPSQDREYAFSRLAGVPELADIVGGPPPVPLPRTLTTEQPVRQPTQQLSQRDVPLWLRGLQAASWPFRQVEERAFKPALSVALSQWTPPAPGTEGMGFFERERVEYETWKPPRFVKGTLEFLPWLAVPGFGGVAGYAGRVAVEAAKRGLPTTMKAALAARKGLSPFVAAERTMAWPMTKSLALIARAIKRPKTLPPDLAEKMARPEERVAGRPIEEVIPPTGAVPAYYEKLSYDDFVEAMRKESGVDVWVNPQRRADGGLYEHESPATGKPRIVLGSRPPRDTPWNPAATENQIRLVMLHELAHAMLKHERQGLVPLASLDREEAAWLWAYANAPRFGVVPDRAWIIAHEGYHRKTLSLNLEESLPPRITSERFVPPVAEAAARAAPEGPPPPGAAPPPPPPEIPPSALFPGGFDPNQSAAIGTLIQLVKAIRPAVKATPAIQAKARAAQFARYEARRQELIAQGVPPQQALTEAIAAMATKEGKLPVAPIPEEFTAIQMTPEAVQTLFGVIQNAPYRSDPQRLNTTKALLRVLYPAEFGMPRRFEMKLMEKTFGPGLAEEIRRKLTLKGQVWNQFLGAANVPRALLSAIDISGLLRQGGILFAGHPITGMKTVIPMLRAMFSDKSALTVEKITLSRRGMNELLDETLRVPLYMAPLPTAIHARLSALEEPFMTHLLDRVGPIRASIRGYVAGLNELRGRVAIGVLDQWKRAGLKYTKEDLSGLNQVINWASGRGSLPKNMQELGPAMNAMMFSPRLFLSRFQFAASVSPWVTKSALARKEAWRLLLSFVGAGSGILSMAKLSGAAEIELDPRSPDFGKIKLKDRETRLDLWTGYSQLLRATAQFATAERKTAGGRIMQANRREVLTRFAESKLSPFAGLIDDIVKGETFLGEDLPPRGAKGVLGQMYQRMMPLAVQDMIDAIRQDGPAGAFAGSTGFVGMGVATYTDEARRERDKAAQKTFGLPWVEVGRQYGQVAQLKLEQGTPAILKAVQEEEERFGGGTPTLIRQWRREGQAVEDTYREAVNLASKEFRATGDGRQFQEKVDQASAYRRTAYGSRAKRKEYQDIIAFYQQPLPAGREFSPSDVARREFYQAMFAPDMYDQYGNYLFDEAARREQEFLVKHGQATLDYIEEYRGARWPDRPEELNILEQARELLRPYWQINDLVWAQMPQGLKELSDQIAIMERTDPERARQALRGYPQILWAREQIARYKKQLRETRPDINWSYRTFYR